MDKEQLRRRLLADRRLMAAEVRTSAGERTASHLLAAPELSGARLVAAYVATGTEPPTLRLLDALAARRVRVLLPVLRSDDDLDWAEYAGEAALEPAARGLLEPAGQRLGADAVADADVVLCPGLAVGRDGVRLGRGGGSYDRVLSRVQTDPEAAGRRRPWTCVLLFEDEVLPEVPAAAHDRAVDAAATPTGVVRFPGRLRCGP